MTNNDPMSKFHAIQMDRKAAEESRQNRAAAWRIAKKTVKWGLIAAGAVTLYGAVTKDKDETEKVEVN